MRIRCRSPRIRARVKIHSRSPQKCIPCLMTLEAFISTSRLLQVYINKKDKWASGYHAMFVEGHVDRVAAEECFPKDLTDYLKAHVREMRNAIEKEDWKKAGWRASVIEGIFLESGLPWIIDHCRKEVIK